MATTIYTDDTLAAFAIGARTDDAWAAVDDVSAEEVRLANEILTPGIVKPADGWLVAQRGAGANMSVDVGSGVAKSDLAVVQGNIAGQGRYLVRKALATINVTVPAADLSQARTDELYLVVADAPYDSGSLSLPRIGYRQGDAGGGAPGPDAAWDAYLKLATVAVAANETAIETAHITDGRLVARVNPASGGVPPGTIAMYGGLQSAVPSGWFQCDGSAKSRSVYSELFAAIGTRWGAGDGSTTFNVPNMADAIPIGFGSIEAVGARTSSIGAGTGKIAATVAMIVKY